MTHPSLTDAQEARFRELCKLYDAVAIRPLPPSQRVALVASATDPTVDPPKLVEVLDHDGRALDEVGALKALGELRASSLKLTEQTTEDILTLVVAAGIPVARAHELTGVARQTIYNRLAA